MEMTGKTERQKLRQRQLREAIRMEISGLQQIEDDELQERIDRHIIDLGENEYLPLKERMTLRNNLFNSFPSGWDVSWYVIHSYSIPILCTILLYSSCNPSPR